MILTMVQTMIQQMRMKQTFMIALQNTEWLRICMTIKFCKKMKVDLCGIFRSYKFNT